MVDIDDFEYRKARRDLHEAVNQLRKMEGKEPIPWAEPMPPYCSFCGKNKNEIQNIIESESAAICNVCVMMSLDIINDRTSEGGEHRKDMSSSNTACSFCGKYIGDVQHLVQGPSVFICDECVKERVKILREESNNDT